MQNLITKNSLYLGILNDQGYSYKPFHTNQRVNHALEIITNTLILIQYLLLRDVFEDGVGLNFLDFFTVMGVVSLSEVCGGVVLVEVDGGVGSSMMVCSPLSAIAWARWLATL
jgi:hypothetical protein